MDLVYKNLEFEVKEITEDDAFMRFEGYASTKNLDLYGDVVEPTAFTETIRQKMPLPMLWQHDHREPIGVFTEASIDSNGLFVKGQMPMEDSLVKGRVRPQMKAGSIRSMSIGFKVLAARNDESGGETVRIITKADLWEVSLVTFPANPAAKVTDFKNKDRLTKEEMLKLDIDTLRESIKSGILSNKAAAYVAKCVESGPPIEEGTDPMQEDTGELKALEKINNALKGVKHG